MVDIYSTTKTKPSNPKILFNIFIVFILAISISALLICSAKMEPKWTIAVVFFFVLSSMFVLFPYKEDAILFCFVSSLFIGIDVNPFGILDLPYIVPMYGFRIKLSDLFFSVLIFLWLNRLLTGSQEKFQFYPKVTIPMVLIWLICSIKYTNTSLPLFLKIVFLWNMGECLLIFLYLANNISSRRKIYIVIFAILFSLVPQIFIGFIQKFTGAGIGLDALGLEGQSSISELRSGGETRVGGTIGSPNKLALYLGVILPIYVSLLFTSIRKYIKIIIILPIILLGGMLDLFTLSRGGWLGLFSGGSLMVYIGYVRLTGKKILIAIILIASSIVLITVTILTIKPVRNRIFGFDYGAAEVRLPLAQLSLEMIYKNPIMGVGLGNFTQVAHLYDKTMYRVSVSFPYPVHNEFLLIASEIGLPALFLFGYILIRIFLDLKIISNSKFDHNISYIAIGITGSIFAWCVHQQFEYSYVFVSPIKYFWLYAGVVQVMKNYCTQTNQFSL